MNPTPSASARQTFTTLSGAFDPGQVVDKIARMLDLLRSRIPHAHRNELPGLVRRALRQLAADDRRAARLARRKGGDA